MSAWAGEGETRRGGDKETRRKRLRRLGMAFMTRSL
jgi:hypothetical protein